jgi:ribonuclease HII
MKTLPRSAGYTEERILIKSGISLIAGIDEVGKGALAGPVIAGAVILPPFPNQIWTHGIRDSKLMSSNQRLNAFQKIIRHSVAYNCGISSSIEIDRFGISKATYLAMERAIKGLNLRPDFLLIDGYPLPSSSIPQKHLVHGDSLSLSIASASIVAKVTRDQIMENLDIAYPLYDFKSHKGYGTKKHLQSLSLHGSSIIHRLSFKRVVPF